jgi:tetratricopeptide (TPR) repeat protein
MAAHAGAQADMATTAGHGISALAEQAPNDAQFVALMHDHRGAWLELETSPGAGTDSYVIAQSNFVRGIVALDRADYRAALSALQAADAAVAKSPDVASQFLVPPACRLALAEEYVGQSAQADADIMRGGHFVDCYRFKGDIDDHRGQWDQARRDYAAAVALAPSIPSSYESWGEALARHGDYAGAIEKFALANRHGPRWSDPLEHWGEALASQGQLREALRKYAAAAPFAPRWGALYLHWGQAHEGLGEHTKAKEKYRMALGLDLSDADRRLLQGCCG